jgi:hypothetical protein
MALTETFLELAPEFGGTRFGPFPGMEIRLGSNPDTNDIVLPENLGVLPDHVKLISQGDGSFIVAPVERTAGVFVYRQGGSAKQVNSPIAIQGASDPYSADAFSLVSPEGPRFYVLQVMQQQEAKTKESQFDQAKKRLSGGSLLAEIKRQGIATFVTTYAGREIQRWGTFVKTGAIFRPRYIISGAAMLVGWAFAGGVGILACSAANQAATSQKKLDTCNDQLAASGMGEGDDSPQLDIYIARVLGEGGARDEEWVRSLATDQDFLVAVRDELSNLYKNEKRMEALRWVYSSTNSDFVRVKKAMEAAGWPPALVRVMAYTAAIESPLTRGKEWTFIESDSIGEEACGRGPMAMTWRQATNLDVPNVSIDAAMTFPTYGAASDEEKAKALSNTAGTLRTFDPPEDWGRIHGRQTDNTQDIVCLYNGEERESVDPRSSDNVEELIKALGKTVGPGARGLPDAETGAFWVQARLIRFFAADYKGEFNKLDLSGGIPSAMLNDTKPVKQYAMRKAAETVAKAVAIPCMARTDPNLKNLDTDKTVGPLPKPLDCIIVDGIINYNVQ